jgi:hypothetical protein
MALGDQRPLNKEGEFDISTNDSMLVDGILASVSADNRTSWRYRTIVKMNPYMANNPEAVAAMAAMPIRSQDLMGQAGAIYGMQVGNSMATLLQNYSPSTQRAIFGQLSPLQQSSLNTLGYSPPTTDTHGSGLFGEIISKAAWPVGKVFGGIGKTVSPVLGPALEGLYQIGDMPFKVYRTIRQLDDASQWIALATGLATAGGILLAPLTGGGSVALAAALNFSRVGLAFTAGMAAAGTASFLSSSLQTGGTSTWVNAWNDAFHGEKLFSRSGIERAEKLLEDPSLVAMAQDLAVESVYPGDLLGIAKELAGTRGSTNPLTQNRQLAEVASKYANPGTPQFQQAYDLLSTLLTLPAFTDAVTALEKSKISIGRDIARLVGQDPSTGFGRYLSGSIDAASYFVLDPFIAVGMTARGMAQMRRGIQFMETGVATERIRQIAQLPEMQRKLGVVARAVEAGDHTLLNRGAREYMPLFDSLYFHKQAVKPIGEFTADDVVEWLVGTDKLKSIMKGVGVVPGASYGQLRGLNRGQYAFAQATGAARDVMRGIADIRIENIRLPQIAKGLENQSIAGVSKESVDALVGFGLKPESAEIIAGFMSNLEARTILGKQSQSIPEYLDNLDEVTATRLRSGADEAAAFMQSVKSDSRAAYQVGRIVGNLPFADRILGPFANFVEGITTRIPGGAIHLAGLEAPDEIKNFVELFRYVGMPSYVRNIWTNSILQAPDAGARLNSITALIDSAVTATGMRMTKAGNDLVNEFLEHVKQTYSLGRVGRYEMNFASGVVDLPIGTRPIADMADMIPIPDLKEMRKAVRQGRLVNTLLGISDNTHILALQNKYWKPAVLLRFGFLLRNMGEESLAMLVRYGTGTWAQELAGRNIAQLEEFFKAESAAAAKNQVSYLSEYQRHVLRSRYDAPIGLRPLVRAIDRIPDGQPWQKVVIEMARHVEDFVLRKNLQFHEFLLNGVGGQFANVMRSTDRLALEQTVNGRMNSIFNRLAFGNEHAIRRMMIGGINETILNDMRAFEGTYLKSIMQKVGTTNLTPWQRASDRVEQAKRLIVDENGNERIVLVDILGERGVATRTTNAANQQPWHEAELARVQNLNDDPIISSMLKHTTRIYDADLEKTLPVEQFLGALQSWAKFVTTGGKFDDPLLQLFLELSSGSPTAARFQSNLRKMIIEEDQLLELADRPGLQLWAERRNEVIRFIQDAFPGTNIPKWEELSQLLAQRYDDFLEQSFIRKLPAGEVPFETYKDGKGFAGYPSAIDNPNPSAVDIGELSYDKILFQGGYTKWKKQLQTFDEIAGYLQGADETARDRMNALFGTWHADPDLLDHVNILQLDPATNRTPQTMTLFRGMEHDGLVEVDAEGNLILTMTPRDWTDQVPALSFSMDPAQASKYAESQVAGVPEGANTINALLAFNGDQVLEASDLTINDLIGGHYDQDIKSLLKLGEDDKPYRATIANEPKFPWGSDSDNRRELSIRVNSKNPSAQKLVDLIIQGRNAQSPWAKDVLWAVAGRRDPLAATFSELQTASSKLAELFEARDLIKLTASERGQLIADFLIEHPSLLHSLGEGGLVQNAIVENVLRQEIARLMTEASNGSFNLPYRLMEESTNMDNYFSMSKAPEFIRNNEHQIMRQIVDEGGQPTREAALRAYLTTDEGQIYVERSRAFLDNYGISSITDDVEVIATVRAIHESMNSINTVDQIIKNLANGSGALAPSNARLVIPKGAWEVRSSIDQASTTSTKLAALVENSTPQAHWPFFNSLDEAMPSMKMQGHIESSTGQWDEVLKKNRDYHGMPETTPVFIVDTRPLFGSNSSLTPLPTVDFLLDPQTEEWLTRLALEEIPQMLANPGLAGTFYPIVDAIKSALTEQSPILVSSKEMADSIAKVIKRFVDGIGPEGTRNIDPLIGLTHFPTEHPILNQGGIQIVNKPRFATTDPAKMFNWQLDGGQVYRDYPLVWDWIDSIELPPGPATIIDRAYAHLEQSIRSGRRLKLFYRESPNTPEVYRNIAGEAVPLTPGEQIQADDILFTSSKMRAEDRVMPDNQIYFEQGDVTYEGSTELMWPILAPTMYDHVEDKLGWSLYDLKGEVSIPTIGGRRKKILTNRTRLRYAKPDHVAKTPAGDLPDWEIVQLYRPVKQNTFERIVQFGFNEVIGPTIDALVRKPMAAHAFHIAAERNRNLIKWVIQSSPEETALRNVVVAVQARVPGSTVTEDALNLWADFGRMVGQMDGVSTASRWDSLQAVSYLRGLSEDEFVNVGKIISLQKETGVGFVGKELNKADAVRFEGLNEFAQRNYNQLQAGLFDASTDGFLQDLQRFVGKEIPLEGDVLAKISDFDSLPRETQDLLSSITDDEWKVIQKSILQRNNVDQEVYEYAAEHVVRDIMPFVDSHEVRSQFADGASSLLPFWYAEENFLKRWAKIFSEGGPAVSLERIRKLQLTYQGLKSVGIVRTDAQGKDYFVYPGSELLFDVIDKVFPGARLPVEALLQTPTSQMVPGFNRDFGRPSITPLAAITMDVVTQLMPEAQTFEEALIGKEYVYGNVVDAIVPRHIANIWRSLGDLFNNDINPKNERIASAMMAAIAHLEAGGNGLPDNATAAQRDEFLRIVRDHARVIVFAQAIGGLFTMGPAGLLQVPEGGSLNWITEGQVTDPADLLSGQYYELISNLGIEKGTQRYLEINKNGSLRTVLKPLAYTISKTTTPSGAPLPSTDEALNFYAENRSILDQYPEAGPWLLPQGNDNSPRSQYAYNTEIISGLRDRRTPQEFITTMKYKEGASDYFAYQKVYEQQYKTLKLSGRDARASELNNQWLMWAETYKATHPLFAEMLVSDDARSRRRRVMDQMRYVINDPKAPKAAHFDALRTLQLSYDAFSTARGQLNLDRTGRGAMASQNLKKAFASWVNDFLVQNPAVMSYWISVLEPESGLE